MRLYKKMKKNTNLLMDFLDYLYDKLHKGNDLFHYFKHAPFALYLRWSNDS